eukprot:TRINITY_DN10500_c0_g1_i10.p1 TRINITY_DN10500_c0_g1~~TRINITY_DN10500_c0_g1_i10.p1  ORF type:complete len:102 (+),score=17.71 TRINITY_DN10500_c0_g1_i10:350-655(+)
MITANGIYVLVVDEKNVRSLHVISSPHQSAPDYNNAFVSNRTFLDNYFNSYKKKKIMVIQVLREGTVTLRGVEVPVMLIEQPVLFPGCGWSRETVQNLTVK